MNNCLYVGSFNPITKAHIKISSDLLKNKTIDYLYYLPVNSQKENLISIENRINMINLVKINNQEILNIYDYNSQGYFNYQTLTKINKLKKIKYIILGTDLFLKFKTFNNYQNILEEYTLIIIQRNDINTDELIKKEYLSYYNKFIIVNKTYHGSSTLARKYKNSKYLKKEIITYIKENNLYN